MRRITTVRIVIPTAVVRLSAGRTRMSVTEQALCFLAGAGSVFSVHTYKNGDDGGKTTLFHLKEPASNLGELDCRVNDETGEIMPESIWYPEQYLQQLWPQRATVRQAAGARFGCRPTT